MIIFLWRHKNLTSESIGDFVNFTIFEDLPEVVGDVEHDALQEEDEGDPLVVGVLHGLALALDPGLNSLIGVLVTLASCIPAWKDKRKNSWKKG